MKKTELFYMYVNDFFELCRLELKSKKTIDSYRDGLNDFRKYLYNIKKKKVDEITFKDITENIIREYLKWLIDNCKSLSTRNSRLTAIKQYIKYCATRQIELVPLELSINTIKCKAVKSKKHNWITKEQVILILDQTTPNKTGIRDRFIMFFMFSTGARLSEMLDIKLKDIVMDTQYPYLILTGKGNKTRVIPITVELLDNLKYYLKLYHPVTNNDDYLFYTILKENHHRMSEDNVQRIVRKYGNKAKLIDDTIPIMHPHLFRHSFGALMYRNGLTLPEVAKLMGHENLATTEIYAETDIDMIKQALSKISNNEIDSKWEKLSEDDKLKVLGLK